MMFVSIILLNLLIAVVGDAYDRVSYDREVNRMRSKAALVVEVDLLLPRWFQELCGKSLFHASNDHVVMIMQEERPMESEDGGDMSAPTVHGGGPSGSPEVAWAAESTGRLGAMKALIDSGVANAVAGMQVAMREQKAQLDALKQQLDNLVAIQTQQSSALGTQLHAPDTVRTMQEQLNRLCEQLQTASRQDR
ncbi:hypothetical protein GPECTOR_215g443 [Gonium pectorale]|uniref:Ion transport domain-containing protein n=1 Tax=Gonium pectorale TaxID=33097 RepID=A0A150FWR5_GONPE|nr:hypothetical protein GPECTOR_215g443 [Gonium pectorale]|eukprot:KXZ42053.1 hypothetical protein GPECTOR_215g443 [Gonium pectorale]